MGCRFEALIGISRSGMSGVECAAIGEEIRDLVLDWHARLSVFEPRSIVSKINRATAHEPVAVDSELFTLLVLCDQIRESTNGVFNIAAGTLMESYGFREHQIPDMQDLTLDSAFELDKSRHTIRKADDRVRLDFGAIAKGYVMDLMKDELLEHGIADAFVHGGTSSTMALGLGLDGQEWRVDLGDGLQAVLGDLSLAVSEIHGRTIECDGNTVGHVMNPLTLSPADGPVQRVACIHESAAMSDAISTACSVSPELIDSLIVQSKDNLCTLVIFEEDKPPKIHDPLEVVMSKG